MNAIIKPKRGEKDLISSYIQSSPANELLMATDTREIFLTNGNGEAKKFSDIVISSDEPIASKNILWVDIFEEKIKYYDENKEDWVESHNHDDKYIKKPENSGQDGAVLALIDGKPTWRTLEQLGYTTETRPVYSSDGNSLTTTEGDYVYI